MDLKNMWPGFVEANGMIKVGILIAPNEGWLGGVNYFKNLLFAIAQSPEKDVQVIVCLGKRTPEKFKKLFSEISIVREFSFLDRKTFNWFLWRITKRIFRSDFILDLYLSKEGLSVVSHSSVWGLRSAKCINWIPDFQHLHLPDMFSPLEIRKRNQEYLQLAKKSDLVILSSFDAAQDFKNFSPSESKKIRVLQFVAQPDEKIFLYNEEELKKIRDKYNLPEIFYFLPNQFWKHKNHILVFEALKILKEQGLDIVLVCTGAMQDYRNNNHVSSLIDFVKDNNLSVLLLGVIDYNDVIALMRASHAVINPSLFEGWSSTVEECKAIGKMLILSDIRVHREQNPKLVEFFNPKSAVELSEILKAQVSKKPSPIASGSSLKSELDSRTRQFSKQYLDICRGFSNFSESALELTDSLRVEGGSRVKGVTITKPLVSIIIATMNGERFLGSVLDSIFSQSFSSYEVIIVDGGSTDGTIEILKRYDDKIRYWVSEKDDGISDAFNKGVLLSEGMFINFQGDGDGFVSCNALEKIFSSDLNCFDLVCSRIRRIGIQGETMYESPKLSIVTRKDLRYRMIYPHQGLFTKRTYFQQYGLFSNECRFAMDYEHLLRSFHSQDVKIFTSDEVVAYWRADGVGEGQTEKVIEEYDRIKRIHKIDSKLNLDVINYWIMIKYRIKKIICIFSQIYHRS